MTAVLPLPSSTPARVATPRRFVMCRPDHFEVTYAINPWMDPAAPVDRARALSQWEILRALLEQYGHSVETVPGEPGLPDMVFAANSAIVIGGRALSARFAHPERQPEGPAFHRWFAARELRELAVAAETNEGEGDFAFAGDRILAGRGFRCTEPAHVEVARFFGLPVLSLELIDPRFYHLDTALMCLDATTVAYYPGAFGPVARAALAAHYPDAILATEADALSFGLNGVSDGRHVFLDPGATELIAALRERGFVPVQVDMSELRKGGGGVKCCVLELHTPRS
ncbi:dimethylargininase [Nocardia caishijiensis]|uniref:N-dimethylarginine dimethylaminohydrolase n=1 Tax=Nocardia caishijiensis TaxID=184756 RepID=A0ABQ6YMW4_9NOCA|nr:dimethylargininase [Nocardia caishijiensis]KAF0847139.1 N-dimethylarginine dimethylaminohydrolase [Nocardia caishijiensis]